nr:CHAT domain-containing protein [uncultured Undibacterium sp.]
MKNSPQVLFFKFFFTIFSFVNIWLLMTSQPANAYSKVELASTQTQKDIASELLKQLKTIELNPAASPVVNEIRVKLGTVYAQSGKAREALRLLMAAADYYRSSSNQQAYASTLHILGTTWQAYGGVQESILSLAKSVAVFSDLGLGYEKELATATLDLARANLAYDLLELALIHAKNALAICEGKKPEMPLCVQHAKTLIADINMEAGDFDLATKIYTEIISAFKEISEDETRFRQDVRAKYLWAQAKILRTPEARIGAILAFEEALQFVESTRGQASLEVGLYLHQITRLYLEDGQSDLAINAATRAIKIIEHHQGETSTTLLKPTINYAQALYQQESYEKMLEQLARALSFTVHDESLKNSLAISDLLTSYSQKKGNLQAAVHFGKRSAEIALTSGRALRLSNPKLGRNYVANRIQVFRKLIHNLLTQDRLIEAQDALDLLKDNEYLDFIGEVGDEMRTAQRNEFEETIRHQFNAQVYSYFYAVYQAQSRRMMISSDTDDKNALNANPEKNTSTQEIHIMEQQLHGFLKEFFGTFQLQKSSTVAPPVASIKKAESKRKALLRFTNKTATLQYFVTEEKLYLLLSTADSQTVKQLAINESQLQNKVNAFLRVLQSASIDPQPKATELYQLLVRPIEAELRQFEIKTILVSPDGVLKKVPFAALYNGERYLVQDYDTALLTQSSWIENHNTHPSTHTVGAFGLTKAIGGLRALPGVKSELTGIVKNRTKGIFQGEIKLDQEFTDASLSAVLSKKYSVLHIASHFIFQPGRDTDSYLVLGDGSTLNINQLKEKRFDFSGTDLVVLSACETARYDKNLNGIPVDGLANVLQTRGAKTVLATQWAIEDKSTSILMPRFYKNLANGLNKVEAISLAQRSFIEQDIKTDKGQQPSRGIAHRMKNIKFNANSKRPYAHPYYWAGFLLMGNIY